MGQSCCHPSQPPMSPTTPTIHTHHLPTMNLNLPTSNSNRKFNSKGNKSNNKGNNNFPTPIPFADQTSSTLATSKSKCPECHKQTFSSCWNWCQNCCSLHFKDNFSKWTSGNSNLDKLIQEIQLQATYAEQVIEWIDYSNFKNVKHIAKGGFGEVLYAEWEDGQIYNWDLEKNCWKRRGKHPVALKKLKGSEKSVEDFLNEVRTLHSITRLKLSFEVTHCFGISKDPSTNEYIMVISYAENGSLHNYLQQNSNLNWSTRINYLLKIALGLEIIHSAGLIHRDFHSGNILMGKRFPMVSDFGLSRYVSQDSDMDNLNVINETYVDGNDGDGSISNNNNNNKNSNTGTIVISDVENNNNEEEGKNSIFGVIPYIAPEVLKGHPYTPASDIYSFGMIMYELLTGYQPFHDTAHNFELITRITSTTNNPSPITSSNHLINSNNDSGDDDSSSYNDNYLSSNSSTLKNTLNSRRPNLFNFHHPKCWIDLMRRCWSDDPTRRPTTSELKEILEKWYQLAETRTAGNKTDLSILKDFRDAENFRVEGSQSLVFNSIKNNSSGNLNNSENHPESCYYSRRIPTIKLVQKLEDKVRINQAHAFTNMRKNSSGSNRKNFKLTIKTSLRRRKTKSNDNNNSKNINNSNANSNNSNYSNTNNNNSNSSNTNNNTNSNNSNNSNNGNKNDNENKNNSNTTLGNVSNMNNIKKINSTNNTPNLNNFLSKINSKYNETKSLYESTDNNSLEVSSTDSLKRKGFLSNILVTLRENSESGEFCSNDDGDEDKELEGEILKSGLDSFNFQDYLSSSPSGDDDNNNSNSSNINPKKN